MVKPKRRKLFDLNPSARIRLKILQNARNLLISTWKIMATAFMLDESNFNLFTRRNIGRSPRGQRAFRRLHNSRGRNVHVNILLAVDDTHVVHWKSILGSCKEEFGQLSEKLGNKMPPSTWTMLHRIERLQTSSIFGKIT